MNRQCCLSDWPKHSVWGSTCRRGLRRISRGQARSLSANGRRDRRPRSHAAEVATSARDAPARRCASCASSNHPKDTSTRDASRCRLSASRTHLVRRTDTLVSYRDSTCDNIHPAQGVQSVLPGRQKRRCSTNHHSPVKCPPILRAWSGITGRGFESCSAHLGEAPLLRDGRG